MKSYTDIVQSKKLAEILPLESADMCYLHENSQAKTMSPSKLSEILNVSKPQVIPCWSLAALLDFLKDRIIFGGNSPEGWFCCYTIKNPTKTLTIYEDSLVDACYKMVIKLHELNLL